MLNQEQIYSYTMSRGDAGKEEKAVTDFWETFAARF